MIKINDNITLRYIPMGNLKTTSVGAYIYRELNEHEASANALLPYVLQRGCRICPTLEEMSKQLEELYGASLNVNVIKHGGVQIMSFNGKTISDRYAPEGEKLTNSITELMLSVMFEPVTENGGFSAEYIRQERKSAKDNILGLLNDKRSYAQKRCIEQMCAGDSYAVSKHGTIEGMDALDEKNLYDYYKKIITSSVIDIFVCGDADIDAVADTVRTFVDKLMFTKAEIPEISIFTSKNSDIREISENMDVTQGKLSIGLTTGITNSDERYWGLMVANSILGGGAHSKLFNNVREKMSLAYYASSSLEKTKGLMFINAGVEFENYKKALDEIYVQLDEMRNGSITDEEFSAARLSLINSLDSYYDDQFYMQLFRVSQRSSGVEYDIEYMKEKVRAVTASDVVEAAKSIKADTVYFLKGVQA